MVIPNNLLTTEDTDSTEEERTEETSANNPQSPDG